MPSMVKERLKSVDAVFYFSWNIKTQGKQFRFFEICDK